MRKQPLEFRAREVAQIMQCWRAGESCSVVGIGSIGKSNLIQHLINPAVLQHHLNDVDLNKFRTILIDPNMFGPLPANEATTEQVRAWAGYELMMHRLFMSFYPFEVLSADEARHFYETYQGLQDGTNPLYAYMGLRYFELGLQHFLRRDIQLVFMFDEFEELMRQMPIKFFHSLRGLRDQYKGQLSYVTFSRAPIETIAQQVNMQALEIEPFKELFNDNVLYIGPYAEGDARRMIDELSERHSLYYSEAMVNFLLHSSGGFAGLLRAAYQSAQSYMDQQLTEDNRELWLRQLVMKPPVRRDCQTIWDSLSLSEQTLLNAVSRLSPYSLDVGSEQAVTLLIQKQLLRVLKNPERLEIQPALLRVFLAGM